MANDSNSTKRYVVRGRVQGVGFRFFVEKHAQRIGLRGYAKNLSDGTVEVVATGRRSELDELEGLLRIGPRLALVSGVESHDAPNADYSYFRVRV
ncbi:MAG: acylphosphatase [Bryobacterales bacterium]|nr:acylphosphatase [Bryobacterales bacterium]